MQMFPDPDDLKHAQDSIENRLRAFDRNLWVPTREEMCIRDRNKAIIEIDTARCIKGALPSRQLKLILAWCVLHQDELMQNWELSKDGKPLNRINPLV